MADHTYHVSYIRVSASDLDQAWHFYGEIMELPLISNNIEAGYLLFNLAGITLIVEKSTEEGELCPCRYLGISLKVQDINEIYESFSSLGVIFSHPPEKQFWGGYLTEFQDPDGNTWTLLESN
jgi:predicted enzyme related to lactoylglutathione lyase